MLFIKACTLPATAKLADNRLSKSIVGFMLVKFVDLTARVGVRRPLQINGGENYIVHLDVAHWNVLRGRGWR